MRRKFCGNSGSWDQAGLAREDLSRSIRSAGARAQALCATVAVVLALAWPPASVADSQTLAAVKARGTVRCGVSEGVAGFSAKDASGTWTGLDADFCRAVAAAVLGDAGKVTFVPLRASARFPALLGRTIDLLARNTTWTLAREAGLNVQFAGILFYDGQAFMVPTPDTAKAVTQLNGASVCVEKGTTHEQGLIEYFAARGMSVQPLVIDSGPEVADAFFAGRCRAYTSDASQLVAARLRAPTGRTFRILPERASKEPLAPVVRSGDDGWLTLVRWVLFALVAAEEHGVTRDNVRAMSAGARDAAVRRALGEDGDLAKALGTDPQWALRAVESVGNYGEMFERNLGAQSPLKLERGLNRLWTKGGLMYAPPLR
jgi:general L-amino acid transport system substrate-binding protein